MRKKNYFHLAITNSIALFRSNFYVQYVKEKRVDDYLNKEQKEIFSEKVRAGKRTYFFDVKATRANDYYLTITESKRRNKDDGYTYEKHKIFLYKEDFNKFVQALNQTVDHVKEELLPDVDFDKFDRDDYHSTNSEISKKTDDSSDLKWD